MREVTGRAGDIWSETFVVVPALGLAILCLAWDAGYVPDCQPDM